MSDLNVKNRFASPGVVAATITATRTLAANSAKIQKINPSGADRTVTLPALTSSVGLWFIVANTGSTYNVLVKNAAAATIATVPPGLAVMVACEGTAWYVAMSGSAASASNDFGATGVKADVVAESTSAAGVTVDGVLLKDGGVTLADASNIILNTTTGSKIGTAVGQKLGFWNATPVVQQASANQAALTNSTGGTADGTLAAVGATNTGDRSSDINNNFTELYTLVTAIRTALVNTGIIKGGA